MSMDGRLNRLMPGLSASERALLVLRSLKDKTPEDPSWRSTMPLDQAKEFNRLLVLMNACNIYLPLYITVIGQRTELLYVHLHWMQTLIAMGLQGEKLGELIQASKRGKAEAEVDRWPLLTLPWKAEIREQSWIQVAEDMHAALRVWLISLWQELRSVDVVLDQVARELEGEDPMRPVMRSVLEKARERLLRLHELLSAAEPLDLQEPDEESMELARTYFESGRRLMERL